MTDLISEFQFGFEPHWHRLRGPASIDPSRYYAIPSLNPSDSEIADRRRRQLIIEQMPVFRSKPFIAGAIFWTYQDYRTPSSFMMGVVDSMRNRRGSWDVLRETYAPVLIESVRVAPASGDTQGATVSLRTRGPIDIDMLAYTLRGNKLRWQISSRHGETVHAGSDLQLPTPAPGTVWLGELEWHVFEGAYRLTVSIIRPTGFVVVERFYDSRDELL